jgi:ABC-type polysaccharide/polyol phosphate export permease
MNIGMYLSVKWIRETIQKPLLSIVMTNPIIHSIQFARIRKARESRPEDEIV